MKPKFTIHCDTHGESPGCLLCRHLREQDGLRYYATRPVPDEAPRVWQAWCLDCHEVLEQEEGWTDRTHSFADLEIACTPCYRQVVQHHQRVPLAA